MLELDELGTLDEFGINDLDLPPQEGPWYTETCPILERHTGDGRIRVNHHKKSYAKVVCEYRVDMDCKLKGGHCSFAF